MHPLLDAILGWCAALGAVLLLCGCGRTVAGLLGLKEGAGFGVSFGAGSWLVITVLTGLGLGLGPGLHGAGLLVASCCLVPVAAWGLRQLWNDLRSSRSADSGPRLLRLPTWLVLALLALWLAPYVLQTLLPDTDWDSATYHRPMARHFLLEGITVIDTYSAQKNFPGAIQLLYACFVACELESGIVPFNLLVVLLLAGSVFELGRRFFGATVGLWAAGLCLSTNLLLELGLDSRIDAFLALYFTLSMHCCFAIRETGARHGWLVLFGMCLGMAIGTKLTGLLAVAMFGSCVLVTLAIQRPRKVMPAFLLGLVCLGIPSGFWYLRNAVKLHDPVYPFLNGLVYRADGGDLRAFYPDLDELIAHSVKPPPDYIVPDTVTIDTPRSLFDLTDLLLDPDRYSDKSLHWLQPLLFLALLLPLFDRRRRCWWLFGFGVAGFAVLGMRAPIVRYLVPVLPILALAAAVVVTDIRLRGLRGLRGPRSLSWVFLTIVLGTGAHNSVREWLKVIDLKPLSYLSGEVGDYEWFVTRGYNGTTSSTEIANEINILMRDGKMSPDSRILMVGEGKFDLFQCATIADISYEGLTWLLVLVAQHGDFRRIRVNLQTQGITHILVNRSYLMWIATHVHMDAEQLTNLEYLRFSMFHLERFLQAHAKLVGSHEGCALYEVG